VSKDFDTTLSDAIDLAAGAAQTAGAPAARIRGRKRTVHKRIAVSTMSLVLVAGGATVAVRAASSTGGHTPQITATSPRITASTSVTASPDPPATSSPSTPGPSTSSQTSSSPPSSNPATSADPHQVVAAAWLTAGQMPFADTFHWKVVHADPQGTSPIGQQLTPNVFYVANNTPFQALTMCADPAKLLGRTTGAQHTQYTATSAGLGHVSSQFIFFFADAASAQRTFTWLQSQYGSSCMPGSGVTTTKTGGDGATSAAWLTLKGSSGPIDMSAYNREYFVQRGSTIAYVFIENSSMLPTTYDDATQLSDIAAHLCVYGGPCS